MEIPRTTFILGAGASCPYGLPTGNALTRDAIDFLQNNVALHYDRDFDESYPLNNFEKISQMLLRSRTPTLDHYIRKNERFAEDLKAAMAGCLWNAENEALDPSKLPDDDDWLAWLYHTHLGAPSPNEFKELPVHFISYNYDRLPEALIATMMGNTHNNDVAACFSAVCNMQCDSKVESRFIHVHGMIDNPLCNKREDGIEDKYSLQSRRKAPEGNRTEFYRRLASEFLTIHEQSPELEKMRESLSRILEDSERIVLLGFGYHPENLGRIGLDRKDLARLCESPRLVGGTGFDILGNARESLVSRLPDYFTLGNPDEKNLPFPERFLA